MLHNVKASHGDILKGLPELAALLPSSSRKKKILLETARKGKDKPGAKTKMGRAFHSYISPNNNAYDPIFTKDIKKLAPDWFVSSVYLNKRQLLEMAKNKNPKPNIKTKLGSALYCYTSPNNKRYDPAFSKKISILAPSWLPRSQIADKKKKQFLEMARKGMTKPDRRSKLGCAFWSYMYASQKNSYDPNFAKEIRKLAPHWFRKCSTT